MNQLSSSSAFNYFDWHVAMRGCLRASHAFELQENLPQLPWSPGSPGTRLIPTPAAPCPSTTGPLTIFVSYLWELVCSVLSLECLSTLLFFPLANSVGFFFKTQFKHGHIWDTLECPVTLYPCQVLGVPPPCSRHTAHISAPGTWLSNHWWTCLPLPLHQKKPRSQDLALVLACSRHSKCVR